MTLANLASSLVVTGGTTPPPEWDRQHRAWLVSNLTYLIGHLHRVGIDDIYLDGSFCTIKPHPGDIDAYFVTDLPTFPAKMRQLKAMDATWTYSAADRLPDHEGKLKWPQWFRYRIEIFFVFRPPYDNASFMGTQNPPVTIDKFFRRHVDSTPRGLIHIVPPTRTPP